MNRLPLSLLTLFAGLALLFTGCGTLERATLEPVTVTNTLPATVVTNLDWQTNVVTLPATTHGNVYTPPALVTNLTPIQSLVVTPGATIVSTNGWRPRAEATATIQAVGAGVNLVAPGIGTLVQGAGTGLLALFAAWKSRQARTATETAASLVKGIETIRQGIQAVPQLATLDDRIKATIAAHFDPQSAEAKLLTQLVGQHTGETGAVATLVKDFAKPATN